MQFTQARHKRAAESYKRHPVALDQNNNINNNDDDDEQVKNTALPCSSHRVVMLSSANDHIAGGDLL